MKRIEKTICNPHNLLQSKKFKQGNEISLNSNLFIDVNAYFSRGGALSNVRTNIFKSQIQLRGGTVSNVITDATSHMIVDDSITWEKLCKVQKWEINKCPFDKLKIVKSKWLSLSIKDEKLHPLSPFEINKNITNLEVSKSLPCEDLLVEPTTCMPNKCFQSLKSNSNTVNDIDKNLGKYQKGFICASASGQEMNFNKHITDKLEALAEVYKNTKDQWRALGYEKAINTLKKHHKSISTYEEAKSLPGIGDRLAKKIWEIIENGALRKLDQVTSDERVKAINLFSQLWGAGPTTAELWVQQGHRTLEDLRTKGKLNRQQEIGLKHFDDLLEKMPREEATEIIDIVKIEALALQPGLEIVGCGSYRRGRKMCGDVDVLLTHLNVESLVHMLPVLIKRLHKIGFLTDDLVNPDGSESVRSKYMGVCKLPGGNSKHRRLDIFVVPPHEYAPALLTYTGSAHFNRSMRLLAKKKGMSLTDQALREGVVRQGPDKIYGGHLVDTPTEESIFRYLGLDYRIPEERDH